MGGHTGSYLFTQSGENESPQQGWREGDSGWELMRMAVDVAYGSE